jgi:hypothetical protein
MENQNLQRLHTEMVLGAGEPVRSIERIAAFYTEEKYWKLVAERRKRIKEVAAQKAAAIAAKKTGKS